jgi:hypothetical protein
VPLAGLLPSVSAKPREISYGVILPRLVTVTVVGPLSKVELAGVKLDSAIALQLPELSYPVQFAPVAEIPTLRFPEEICWLLDVVVLKVA